jgi:catechol 2,3-dioxygenase-like lactoylglutathione lyase family enzyme
VSGGRAAWLPSAQQLLLLQASLWTGDRALAAWAQWRRGAPNLESIDLGSRRLLSLAYRNLGPELSGDPDAARLKDIYRQSWGTNQRGLKVGRRAIDALQAAGLEVLALKGAALIGSAYRDPGARPLGDVDLAVRPERIGEAVRALRAAGLTATDGEPERRLAVRHSLAFRDPSGQEVDLHRGMLWRPGLDQEFWRESREAEAAGARVRILNPTDQLLHVCAHGAAWSPVPPLRWAADAYKTIEVGGEKLDWERLAALARLGHLTLPLAEALGCLAEELEAPVPEATRDELSRVPVSRGERRAHHALAQPPSPRRSLAMLSWFRERYRAEAALSDSKPSIAGFAVYMQAFWGLERPSQVPAYALRRALRRRS